MMISIMVYKHISALWGLKYAMWCLNVTRVFKCLKLIFLLVTRSTSFTETVGFSQYIMLKKPQYSTFFTNLHDFWSRIPSGPGTCVIKSGFKWQYPDLTEVLKQSPPSLGRGGIIIRHTEGAKAAH